MSIPQSLISILQPNAPKLTLSSELGPVYFSHVSKKSHHSWQLRKTWKKKFVEPPLCISQKKRNFKNHEDSQNWRISCHGYFLLRQILLILCSDEWQAQSTKSAGKCPPRHFWKRGCTYSPTSPNAVGSIPGETKQVTWTPAPATGVQVSSQRSFAAHPGLLLQALVITSARYATERSSLLFFKRPHSCSV